MPETDERVDAPEIRADQHDAIIARLERSAEIAMTTQRQNFVLLNALRATQAGHDARLGTINARLDTIDGKMGMLAAGMHAIELLLGRMVDDEE